jgi:hypothetical protein
MTLACHAITEAEIVAERYLPSPPNRNCATTIVIMASVTSLDSDMRKLRLDRYTPQAANEVRSFIEESLGERLDGGDLLASLKDGVALCKYGFSSLFQSVLLCAHANKHLFFQTGQSCSTKHSAIQDQGCNAFRSDGKHRHVPQRVFESSIQFTVSRHIPHR